MYRADVGLMDIVNRNQRSSGWDVLCCETWNQKWETEKVLGGCWGCMLQLSRDISPRKICEESLAWLTGAKIAV
jgi:hypothetical protein